MTYLHLCLRSPTSPLSGMTSLHLTLPRSHTELQILGTLLCSEVVRVRDRVALKVVNVITEHRT